MTYLALGLACGWGLSVLVLAIMLDRRNKALRDCERESAALLSLKKDNDRAKESLQEAIVTLQARAVQLENENATQAAAVARAWAAADRCAPLEEVKTKLRDALR